MSRTQAEQKVRCSHCGRPSASLEVCPSCGNTLAKTTVAAETQSNVPAQRQDSASSPLQQPGSAAVSVLYGTSVPPNTLDLPNETLRNSVSGRVLLALQEPTQPADFDIWRWIAVPAWGLILFLLPPTVVLAVWQSAGLMAALVVGTVFFFLMRFIFSGHLLQSWELISALHGRHVVEPMPVTMLRVRTAGDHEVQVRLKGHLRGGSTTVGDRVIAEGFWRHRVLHAARLRCERTGAFIFPIQPCALRSAVSGSIILTTMVFWLAVAGIPWVQAQYSTFTNTVQSHVNAATQHIPSSPYQPASGRRSFSQ